MSQNRTRFRARVLSLFLAFSFSLSEAGRFFPSEAQAFDAPTSWAAVATDPSKLIIPVEFGEIKEIRRGAVSAPDSIKGRGTPPLLIHIQDAHANWSGQENLAKLLDSIFSRYGAVPVLVEGGTKDDSLNHLKPLATPAVWKRAARKFLLEGKMSGEEYLNLTSPHPMRILGVEDAPLYRGGLEAYADLAQTREEALARVKRLRAAAAVVKRTAYPKELLVLEEACEEEGRFAECAQKLGEGSRVKGEGEYASLEIFRRAMEKEKQIDFDAARLEQAAVSEKVHAAFNSPRTPLFKKEGGSFLDQLSEFSEFVRLAEKLNILLSNYPALSAYRNYLEFFRSIDFSGLIDDMEQAVEARFGAEHENVRLLHTVDRHLALLEKAHEIRMSSEEYAQLAGSAADFTEVAIEAYLNRRLAERGSFRDLIPVSDWLARAAPQIDAFYRSAAERDDAFIRNAEKWMKAEKADVAVLITGGYHTESLKKKFREKGWSYAVVTPRITSETIREKYERILLEPLRRQRPIVSLQGDLRADQSGIVAAKLAEDIAAPRREELMRIAVGFSGSRLATQLAEKERSLEPRVVRHLKDALFTTVDLGELNGRKVVIKKFKGGWFGRALTRNTVEAHRRMRGVKGIPRLLGFTASGAMVIDYAEGEELYRFYRAKNVPPGFFDDYRRILDSLHSRGVLNLDYFHSTDVIVATDGAVHVIDLSPNVFAAAGNDPVSKTWNAFVRRIMQDQIRVLARKKIEWSPLEAGDEDRRLAASQTPFYDLHRSLYSGPLRKVKANVRNAKDRRVTQGVLRGLTAEKTAPLPKDASSGARLAEKNISDFGLRISGKQESASPIPQSAIRNPQFLPSGARLSAEPQKDGARLAVRDFLRKIIEWIRGRRQRTQAPPVSFEEALDAQRFGFGGTLKLFHRLQINWIRWGDYLHENRDDGNYYLFLSLDPSEIRRLSPSDRRAIDEQLPEFGPEAPAAYAKFYAIGRTLVVTELQSPAVAAMSSRGSRRFSQWEEALLAGLERAAGQLGADEIRIVPPEAIEGYWEYYLPHPEKMRPLFKRIYADVPQAASYAFEELPAPDGYSQYRRVHDTLDLRFYIDHGRYFAKRLDPSAGAPLAGARLAEQLTGAVFTGFKRIAAAPDFQSAARYLVSREVEEDAKRIHGESFTGPENALNAVFYVRSGMEGINENTTSFRPNTAYGYSLDDEGLWKALERLLKKLSETKRAGESYRFFLARYKIEKGPGGVALVAAGMDSGPSQGPPRFQAGPSGRKDDEDGGVPASVGARLSEEIKREAIAVLKSEYAHERWDGFIRLASDPKYREVRDEALMFLLTEPAPGMRKGAADSIIARFRNYPEIGEWRVDPDVLLSHLKDPGRSLRFFGVEPNRPNGAEYRTETALLFKRFAMLFAIGQILASEDSDGYARAMADAVRREAGEADVSGKPSRERFQPGEAEAVLERNEEMSLPATLKWMRAWSEDPLRNRNYDFLKHDLSAIQSVVGARLAQQPKPDSKSLLTLQAMREKAEQIAAEDNGSGVLYAPIVLLLEKFFPEGLQNRRGLELGMTEDGADVADYLMTLGAIMEGAGFSVPKNRKFYTRHSEIFDYLNTPSPPIGSEYDFIYARRTLTKGAYLGNTGTNLIKIHKSIHHALKPNGLFMDIQDEAEAANPMLTLPAENIQKIGFDLLFRETTEFGGYTVTVWRKVAPHPEGSRLATNFPPYPTAWIERRDRLVKAVAIMDHGGPLDFKENLWHARNPVDGVSVYAKSTPEMKRFMRWFNRIRSIAREYERIYGNAWKLSKQTIPTDADWRSLKAVEMKYRRLLTRSEREISEYQAVLASPNFLDQFEFAKRSLSRWGKEKIRRDLKASVEFGQSAAQTFLLNAKAVQAFLSDTTPQTEPVSIRDWLNAPEKFDTKQRELGSPLPFDQMDLNALGDWYVRVHPELSAVAVARVPSNGLKELIRSQSKVRTVGLRSRLSEDGRFVVLTFSNPGFLENEKIKRLFQLNPDRADFAHGIALPFTADAIRKMGGDIWVENETLDGHPFVSVSVKLPRAAAQTPIRQPLNVPPVYIAPPGESLMPANAGSRLAANFSTDPANEIEHFIPQIAAHWLPANPGARLAILGNGIVVMQPAFVPGGLKVDFLNAKGARMAQKFYTDEALREAQSRQALQILSNSIANELVRPSSTDEQAKESIRRLFQLAGRAYTAQPAPVVTGNRTVAVRIAIDEQWPIELKEAVHAQIEQVRIFLREHGETRVFLQVVSPAGLVDVRASDDLSGLTGEYKTIFVAPPGEEILRHARGLAAGFVSVEPPASGASGEWSVVPYASTILAAILVGRSKESYGQLDQLLQNLIGTEYALDPSTAYKDIRDVRAGLKRYQDLAVQRVARIALDQIFAIVQGARLALGSAA